MARPRKPRWPPIPRRAYGSGSISRDQKTGTLRARLPARIDPKRTAREFGADELAQAERWLAAAFDDQTQSGAMALVEWSGYWWQTYVRGVRPETTARLYLHALKLLARHDRVALASLRSTHFQEVVTDLAARLAPATLAVRVSIWRSCLEAAVDAELIARNPVRRLVLPKAPKSIERRGWTERESRALWAAIRGHRFEAIYAVVLGLGLRIGAVLGLSWQNVDFSGHRIWVQGQYTAGVWRDAPKGNNPQWVHAPEPVLLLLARHRDAQPPGTGLCFASPHKRAVRTAQGRARVAADARAGRVEYPWSYSTVRREFLTLAVSAGIVDQRLHGGRHGLASYLIDQGIPLPVVSEVLTHADTATTTRYTHGSEAGHLRARELVSNLLSDGVSEGHPAALGGQLGGDAERPPESAAP